MWGGSHNKTTGDVKPATLNWRSGQNTLIAPKTERKLSQAEREELLAISQEYRHQISPNAWVSLMNDPEVINTAFALVTKLELYRNFDSQQWYNLLVHSPKGEKAIRLARMDDGHGFRLLNSSHWRFLLKNSRKTFGKYYKMYYTCDGEDAMMLFGDTMCTLLRSRKVN